MASVGVHQYPLPSRSSLIVGSDPISSIEGSNEQIVEQLGHQPSRVWLAANPDPQGRAYGFYRRQGFVAAGQLDDAGDEILELLLH